MSDYTKTTDFAAKDALLSGSSGKKIMGSEIGAEFDAIAVAVATKADTTDIGVSIQAYDADTAKTDVDQSWTGAQRATITTDNDGSFDMAAANDFSWTPTGADTLEFTNEASGQRGCIWLDNSSGYAITLGAEVVAATDTAANLSVAGEYWIAYWCYDGTNVAISFAGSMA
jgi:hypothetical protein